MPVGVAERSWDRVMGSGDGIGCWWGWIIERLDRSTRSPTSTSSVADVTSKGTKPGRSCSRPAHRVGILSAEARVWTARRGWDCLGRDLPVTGFLRPPLDPLGQLLLELNKPRAVVFLPVLN